MRLRALQHFQVYFTMGMQKRIKLESLELERSGGYWLCVALGIAFNLGKFYFAYFSK